MEPTRGIAQTLSPQDHRQGIAIRDGLAHSSEVGIHTQRLPASAQGETEARAHVVRDQRGPLVVADAA